MIKSANIVGENKAMGFGINLVSVVEPNTMLEHSQSVLLSNG